MKNNFITKIIGATLAFAMMIGGAVGLNAAKEAKEVHADQSHISVNPINSLTNKSGTQYISSASSYTAGATIYANNWIPNDTQPQIRVNQGNTTSLSASNFWMYNSTAFADHITKITVTFNTSVTKNYFQIHTSSSAALTSNQTFDANKSGSLVSGNQYKWEYAYNSSIDYFRFGCAKNGGTVKITEFTVYYGQNSTPALSFSEESIQGEIGDNFSFTWIESNLTTGITWTPASDSTDVIDYTVDTVNKTVSGTLTGAGQVTLTGTSGTASDSVLITSTAHLNHRKYTVASTSSVTSDGDTITGAEVTFSNTYSTKDQLTSGKQMVLTITGLENRVNISKLVLSMHSNGSSGAGYVKISVDGDEEYLAGNSSGIEFNNNFGDNKSYGTTYRDVTWDNLSYSAIDSIVITVRATANSLYCQSFDIFFEEEEIVDTVTALSVSPNSWAGYDSQTINVSDYTVSVTKNGAAGTASDYTFQGIGYMNGDLFVPRVADFSTGHPMVADTRLCWKANYPTTAGGSTYLYAYVTLTVQADSVSTVVISGDLSKTLFTTGDEWNTAGLVVTATYSSSSVVDVTSNSTFNFYSDAAMTNEVPSPADLGSGADQSIYIKATCSNVSNETGYEQTVSVVKTSRVTFDATLDIGADSPNPGVSKNGVIIATASGNGTFARDDNYRIYSGREVTITSTAENIVEIKFTCTSAKYNALTGEGYTATGSYGVWTGDASSVTLTSSGEQSRITKVVVTVASALHDVETTLSTTTALSYHYEHEGNVYTYTNVAIRFGSLMEQSLWNSLDSESLIAGYGVLITDDSVVGENDDIADAYDLAELSPEITDHYMSKAEKATPSAATDKQKSDAGVAGDYYIWNLYLTVEEANFETTYVAGAYIKLVTGDVVFMNKASFSVKSLAADYLANRNCNQQTAGGSLYNLAHFGE